MFTSGYIINLAILADKKESAQAIISSMKHLDITNVDVITKAQEHIINNDKANTLACEYMFSFFPKGLIGVFSILNMSGAFATDITGKASLNAELKLQTNLGDIYLKFDNENKCLYHQAWMQDTKVNEILDEYLVNNSKFNCWINA